MQNRFKQMVKELIVCAFLFFTVQNARAQFLMDLVDTTKDMGKSMLSIYKKFDNVRIGGYMQPQFQVAETQGAKSYAGGDFLPKVNNRFMLRRGRLRFDYIHLTKNEAPALQFVFQFDVTERGVFMRDFWGRIFENKYKLFSFTTGMFARPFSYELNLSSSDRETPERGRMSQILMKTERDLGAMLSLDSRRNDNLFKYLKIDAGIFNGPGLTAPADFDSHKDLITRVALKPFPVNKSLKVSAAVSYLNGGLLQNNKYLYKTTSQGAGYSVDSSSANEGNIAPRKYYGADMQLKFTTPAGTTELRGEFIKGTQTGTRNSSETPSALFTGSDGHYIRKFNGAYFYLLQNLFSPKHQLVIKYDWYDPNTDVSEDRIGTTGTNFTVADIKFSTLGFGYNFYINPNLRLVLYYDNVRNERTALSGYTSDTKDDVFTFRMQFRF